jgi:uncharacterized OB-fold protein
MTPDDPPALALSRCTACKARFLPREGRCPRCGSGAVEAYTVPPSGAVVAATELVYPPPGWPAPHRLALVEVPDGVRLLGVVEGPLPPLGSAVTVQWDDPVYRVRAVVPPG